MQANYYDYYDDTINKVIENAFGADIEKIIVIGIIFISYLIYRIYINYQEKDEIENISNALLDFNKDIIEILIRYEEHDKNTMCQLKEIKYKLDSLEKTILIDSKNNYKKE